MPSRLPIRRREARRLPLPEAVDKLASADTNAEMLREMEASGRRKKRALVAGAAACLLVLRALIVILFADVDRIVHAAPGASPSEAFCLSGGGGPARPAHSADDRHCPSCASAERQRMLDAVAAPPDFSALPANDAAASPVRPSFDAFAPRSRQRAAAWRSRAPPSA